MPVRSRVALVTGGASGVGLALGEALARRGDRPILLDLAEEQGRTAADSLGVRFLCCDVGSRGDWQRAAADIVASGAAPEIVVFNAGAMTRPMDARQDDDIFEWIGRGGYDRVFRANVDGIAYGLEALLPVLTEGASIVVTVSTAGLSPAPFDPFYAASKHAAIGLVRSVAPLLKRRGIRLNAFCPGAIATAMLPRDFVPLAPNAMIPAEAADAILQIAASPGTGEAWVKLEGGQAPFRHEFPKLPLG